jgi:hypothetical protein
VILESCATKIFLANPDMDQELYRRQFHLNDTEIALIAALLPKQQFLIKTPELAKVANGSTPTTRMTTASGRKRSTRMVSTKGSNYWRRCPRDPNPHGNLADLRPRTGCWCPDPGGPTHRHRVFRAIDFRLVRRSKVLASPISKEELS